MSPGWWTLAGVSLAVLTLGALLRVRAGRITTPGTFRGEERGRRPVFEQLPPEMAEALRGAVRPHGTEADAAVTLVQLSTAFCAPCRHTRVLLSALAEREPAVRHVEFDLSHHPEWSTPLGVHTTPTTIALDPNGHELFRIRGVPRREGLTEALRSYVD
ncbi:TlpA family protein disulfide reductase [Actinopolyspora mortivallis]|uniref:TlpA family protein disulfide reductase n=1 Tax=Actinopolyspora mortivallis TaxID=33906 RepID=UPI00035EC191|nr:thioredoxin family protein [Actinopolyspora mortivallis]